jgi:hypothetical protein
MARGVRIGWPSRAPQLTPAPLAIRYSESSVNVTEPEPSGDFVSLYRRAFAEYGPRALWNMRPIDDPTPADALAITKALRTHGGMEGRRLAENIERLCRAAY